MRTLFRFPNRIPGRSSRTRCTAFGLATALGLAISQLTAFEISAVLIATGDGTGNTTAPTADPGFDNVGIIVGLSGVYVGNGWVLTANHVGENSIQLLGVTYDPVPGSKVRFQNPDTSLADLIAFKLLGPDPPLPALSIASASPGVNTLVTVIGRGRNRGTATTWMGIDGWNWGGSGVTRWGTNKILDINQLVVINNGPSSTQSFSIRFDDLNRGQSMGQHEAALAEGDSGGGAFTGSGGSAELVGILFAIGLFLDQPGQTSLYGNLGYVSDLFAYRTEILALIDQPECSDGLDDDGDGLIDFPDDPGCSDALDGDERGPDFICDNGLDDDLDGLIDFPADDGCLSPTDQSEAPLRVPNSLPGAGLLGLMLYSLARRTLRRDSILVD